MHLSRRRGRPVRLRACPRAEGLLLLGLGEGGGGGMVGIAVVGCQTQATSSAFLRYDDS